MTITASAIGKIEIAFNPKLALPLLLENYRQSQPDKIALIEDKQHRSWGQMVERCYQMANGLIELGVQPGDRVAILSRNSMAYSEMFIATLIAGACAVPLQSMITDESLKLMLVDSGAKVLVVSEEFAPMTKDFLADQKQIIAGGLLGFNFSNERFTDVEAWLEKQNKSAPGVTIDPDAEFNIIYSSGTTGVPKGIVHSHKTRQTLGIGLGHLGILPESITLVCTPLYSNTTITTWWPSIFSGATIIIMSKFNAERALELISQYKVTNTMLVPVQYDRIMQLANYKDFDLSSMQVKYCTSAPLREALKKDIIDNFPGELIEFYGLTEGGASTLFQGSIAKEMGKLGSVGPPVPESIIKILDDTGKELPAGKIGEIVGHSSNMSKGYHNRSDANNEMFWHDSNGVLYYKTGDVGYLDDDGWLYLSDRKKDMIISGGFNIYATDLELVLLKHEAVYDVAVIALPSREWGETPLAVVVKDAGNDLKEETLRNWANAKLGKSQRISKLIFINDLPKSSIGKVLKKELRQTYVDLADA
jgi:long-chain acyl-CoA synthetase